MTHFENNLLQNVTKNREVCSTTQFFSFVILVNVIFREIQAVRSDSGSLGHILKTRPDSVSSRSFRFMVDDSKESGREAMQASGAGWVSSLKNLFPTKLHFVIFIGYMALFINQGTVIAKRVLHAVFSPNSPCNLSVN